MYEKITGLYIKYSVKYENRKLITYGSNNGWVYITLDDLNSSEYDLMMHMFEWDFYNFPNQYINSKKINREKLILENAWITFKIVCPPSLEIEIFKILKRSEKKYTKKFNPSG